MMKVVLKKKDNQYNGSTETASNSRPIAVSGESHEDGQPLK